MKFLRQDGWFQPVAGADIVTSTATTTGFLTYLTKSTTADIAVASTSVLVDGPVVSQGSSGIWFATGTITITNGGVGNTLLYAQLWDGTNIIDTASGSAITSLTGSLSVSGIIASPTGNLRISAGSNRATTMSFNATGASKDCTVTVIRIG